MRYRPCEKKRAVEIGLCVRAKAIGYPNRRNFPDLSCMVFFVVVVYST